MTKRQYELIIELKNEVEARLLESVLAERDIPHFVKSYHDAAYDGLFQQQLGWGHVEAPSRYREEIEGIYASIVENQKETKCSRRTQ